MWDVGKLWELSERLPVKRIKIESVKELDQDCWFGIGSTSTPTIRNVAKHCKRIIEAKMEYPILLSSDGRLIDGGHRIAKALIHGQPEVDAVFIESLPAADVVLDANAKI